MLRAVRQMHGWSQRDLAAHTDRAPSTVARWESGERPLSVADLDLLLDEVQLDLALVPRPAEAPAELVAHLRLSTSARLWSACGGVGRPDLRPPPPLWRALLDLAGHAHAVVEPSAALAVWLPGRRVVEPVTARVRWRQGQPQLLSPLLHVDEDDELSLTGTVPVGVGQFHAVHVASPEALALDPTCQRDAQELRQAALLLDRGRGRDTAGRRSPAHRVPDENGESWDLMHRPQYGYRTGPSRSDSRGWRLDAPVSLAQWLDDHGLPRKPDWRAALRTPRGDGGSPRAAGGRRGVGGDEAERADPRPEEC